MQTFLPYEDFEQSAKCLDMRRLGKQRVEVLQLLNALMGRSKGWVNHPAAKMWRGREYWLAIYGMVVCREWIDRGYRDTCMNKIASLYGMAEKCMKPDWLGDPEFHASHRSVLLAKDPVWYGNFGWTEQPAVKNSKGSFPYVWPEESDVLTLF